MRTIYIASLITKKEKYDGERIKSTYIFNSLNKVSSVICINLSKHKFFNTVKFLMISFFLKKKIDYLIISKDSHGANTLQRLLKVIHFPNEKIIYFQIGSYLYDGIIEGSMRKDYFDKIKLLVVETQTMKNELASLGFKNVDVFPNFKKVYDVPSTTTKYPKETLLLVFFSRIQEEKGIYGLIDVLIKLNKEQTKYRLDIYGRPHSEKDKERILSLAKEHDFLNYNGKIEINGIQQYKMLSKYDVHVFPTFFASEGLPGTIIDFFIAGVPTLSSSFVNHDDILNKTNSIIFKERDWDDLEKKLNYIYDNQDILPKLRKGASNKKTEYSVEKFEEYLKDILFNRL